MPDVFVEHPAAETEAVFSTKTEYSRQKIDLGLKVMLEIEKMAGPPNDLDVSKQGWKTYELS